MTGFKKQKGQRSRQWEVVMTRFKGRVSKRCSTECNDANLCSKGQRRQRQWEACQEPGVREGVRSEGRSQFYTNTNTSMLEQG